MIANVTTTIISDPASTASTEAGNEAVSDVPQQETVLERCGKCDALLDVSGCAPLTETVCPTCGALIKVIAGFHHFVLLKELGQGGAGTVYRAFDQTLERDVALKLLRNEHTRNPEYLEGLEREARITASINHPHVVKVYSAGCKNGFYYIAMEIVGGGSLADRIERRGGRLTEGEVLSLGIQLAEGLQAAYAHGLLHRDVKPGNILFADEETIKVSDFGLALPLEQATGDSSEIWGTLDYIAPEKLLQQGEDLRSDIYSLGCTLFHCLAGAPPLDTTVIMAVIQNQVARTAPNVQKLAPQVSGATAFVIKRCLEKNPSDRYQDYGELIEYLQYARDQAASSQPQTERPAAGTSGRKTLMISGAAALLAMAAAVAGYLTMSGKPAKNTGAAASGSQAQTVAVPTAPAAQKALEKPAPAAAAALFEGESLAIFQSSGQAHHVLAGPSFSGNKGTVFEARAEGDYVIYLLPNVAAGSYDVRVGIIKDRDRGISELTIGKPEGKAIKGWSHPFALQDGYAAAETSAEVDLGMWTPSGFGDKAFKFRVAGKNAASSGYGVALDYIKLVPIESTKR